MARTPAALPPSIRLTDHISVGVLTARFPLDIVTQVLFETERLSLRERDLLAHVMVYYAIALTLYADVSTREVLRCLLEGVLWLGEPGAVAEPAGPSGISQARTRLGAAPLEALYRAVVQPVATRDTPEARHRDWQVMSLDGTTLDVADTAANRDAFGRPASARGANATGAALLWRVKANAVLPVETRYADGSYRSALRWNRQCRSTDRTPISARVIEYTRPGVRGADARDRLITTILEPDSAPAPDLAALYD